MDKRVILGLVLVALLIGGLGYEIGYQSGYDYGRVGGITYRSQVDPTNVVLGLFYVPTSGYYIVNKNYGSFKANATNQIDAIKELQKEISPCL